MTAANMIGASSAASFGPTAQVISDTLLAPAPAGTANPPVPGDQVLVYALPLCACAARQTHAYDEPTGQRCL